MAMLLESRLLIARGLRNAQRVVRPLGSIEDLVRQVAPGRSFVDVGAMWDVHGKISFLAEECGATSVTAADISSSTDQYRAEHERRGSKVRFVEGDMHEDRVIDEIGPHDVVWCAGVLYHCPNPVLSVECLRRLTRETLVLMGATVPAIAGSRNGGVFFPALDAKERRAYDRAYSAVAAPGKDLTRHGLTTPFDPALSYVNWWWGLSPAATAAVLETSGFRVIETKTNGFHTRIVARVI